MDDIALSISGTNPEAPVVLIVDDSPENLMVLGDLLEPIYRVRAASSGVRAIHTAQSDPKPDIILLDIMMPEMDGYEVLTQLKQNPISKQIPVIFITALNNSDNEEKGLALGAVDYITKPINPAIVLARVQTHIELKKARDILAKENEWLESEVKRRMHENLLIQDLTLRALACVAEVRDLETGHHIIRTQRYVEILARDLAKKSYYREILTEQTIEKMSKAAALHDIGKVGIPDAILHKPGKLTAEEFEIMKQHTTLGADAINNAIKGALASVDEQIAQQADGAFDLLRIAEEIARSHHEKWDGSGYPSRLSQADIPLSARLMALADVFDALVNRRVYKPPYSIDETIEIITEGRGKHFDPEVVDSFLGNINQFIDVATHYPEKN